MTISEYQQALNAYRTHTPCPPDFFAFWQARMAEPVLQVETQTLPFSNPEACYETLTLSLAQRKISARWIRPAGEGRYPLVLMFHDLNRGVRGWHHMSRFLAQGYAVLALDAAVHTGDWKLHPEQIDFSAFLQDALVLANYAYSLSSVDFQQIVTWGEGLGGGLALAVAAMLPGVWKCCALNPMPGDLLGLCPGADATLAYCDIANFAPLVRAEVLMGVCLMDEYAPPEGQYAIYHQLDTPKTLKVYPKYAHERVNFFENALLAFLHP